MFKDFKKAKDTLINHLEKYDYKLKEYPDLVKAMFEG